MAEPVILIVEDNPSDIELMRRILAIRGICGRAEIAEDGRAALQYLAGTEGIAGPDLPLPNVMLLDLKLPKLDGLSVLRCVRGDPRTRLLPVVVLTTSTEPEDLRASYELGANSFVRKEVDFDRFSDTLVRIAQYWLEVNCTLWAEG
jgi:two-component system response regulator